MAKQFPELDDKLIEFISAQKVFFVGTAGAAGRVNISPKGMDSFRVLSNRQVAWLNLTGSGNETSAHVQENGRMTIMFMAVDGSPLILRLYGQAEVVHPYDDRWLDCYQHFPDIPGARQVFVLNLDLVQTSCGFAVPLYEYQGNRELLTDWATKQGEAGIKRYWQDKNQTSMDGANTHIISASEQ